MDTLTTGELHTKRCGTCKGFRATEVLDLGMATERVHRGECRMGPPRLAVVVEYEKGDREVQKVPAWPPVLPNVDECEAWSPVVVVRDITQRDRDRWKNTALSAHGWTIVAEIPGTHVRAFGTTREEALRLLGQSEPFKKYKWKDPEPEGASE